jgi:ferredoxin
LLNDAYDILATEDTRDSYNQQLEARRQVPDHLALATREEPSKDLGPTWKWKPKRHGEKPKWTGEPLSRSVWHKVPVDERGEKHEAQMFVFVDEWSCICCRNCCDVAPKTFCIDAESGRARAYSQWGDTEAYLDYALAACPVDCISWVTREHLQRLEFVTAETQYEKGVYSMPCPMQMRQGTISGIQKDDPFEMADTFARKQHEREERARRLMNGHSGVDEFAARIGVVISRLSPTLRSKLRGVWER